MFVKFDDCFVSDKTEFKAQKRLEIFRLQNGFEWYKFIT